MLKIYENIEQGSDEWLAMRLGMPTASRFSAVMAKGQGKTRTTYMQELAAEALTGLSDGGFTSADMAWGTKTEPQARATYELESGNECILVGFGTNHGCGASPDSLVGAKGGAEIKCPKTKNQIVAFLSGKMPSTHRAQVQGNMWIFEREWWDFVSFDPRINGASSYFCTRIMRDDDYIKELADQCGIFNDELAELINTLS